MRYRTLGRTGLRVSELGHGTWGIGKSNWIGAEDEESLRALRRAIELGVNFIDTALAYGNGHSERLVGRPVREAGTDVYVATKIPPKNLVWPAQDGTPAAEAFQVEPAPDGHRAGDAHSVRQVGRAWDAWIVKQRAPREYRTSVLPRVVREPAGLIATGP